MADLFGMLYSWLSFLPVITVRNFIEIAIIAFLVYELLAWIKDSRAWSLLKGIVVILVFAFGAYIFQLDTITWILEKIVFVAATAIIIIFQPELRKALEQLGSRNFIGDFLSFDDSKRVGAFNEKVAGEVIRATFDMAKVKTGALMVIEREQPLPDIEATGIPVDGLISSQLLINIFEHNTPLHDGAVLIRGDRVVAATCYLPLSDNVHISKDLGTRHRSAVGMSEVSDAVTIVVSEETGRVSVAHNGTLKRVNDPEALRGELLANAGADTQKHRFVPWRTRTWVGQTAPVSRTSGGDRVHADGATPKDPGAPGGKDGAAGSGLAKDTGRAQGLGPGKDGAAGAGIAKDAGKAQGTGPAKDAGKAQGADSSAQDVGFGEGVVAHD
jgi:diadenylate cyclase